MIYPLGPPVERILAELAVFQSSRAKPIGVSSIG
jgi:hypothetical protein